MPQLVGKAGATDAQWITAKDIAKPPTMQRIAPCNKEFTKVENSLFRQITNVTKLVLSEKKTEEGKRAIV